MAFWGLPIISAARLLQARPYESGAGTHCTLPQVFVSSHPCYTQQFTHPPIRPTNHSPPPPYTAPPLTHPPHTAPSTHPPHTAPSTRLQAGHVTQSVYPYTSYERKQAGACNQVELSTHLDEPDAFIQLAGGAQLVLPHMNEEALMRVSEWCGLVCVGCGGGRKRTRRLRGSVMWCKVECTPCPPALDLWTPCRTGM